MLAVAQSGLGSRSSSPNGDIGHLVLAGDHLYYVDRGTVDPLNNPRADDAIYGIALPDGTPEVAVAMPDEQLRGDLRIAGNRLYFTTDDALWSAPLDGELEPRRVSSYASAPWLATEDWVYYVTENRGVDVRRVRPSGEEDQAFVTAAGPVSDLRLTDGGLMVETENETLEWQLDLWAVNVETAVASLQVSPHRTDAWRGDQLSTGGALVFVEVEGRILKRYSVTTGGTTNLAVVPEPPDDQSIHLRAVDATHAFYWYVDRGNETVALRRSPLAPGAPEDLYTSNLEFAYGEFMPVVISDDYIYWAHASRVLRKPLPTD